MKTSGFTMRARILLGFALILLTMIAMTAIGVVRVNAISTGLATIGDVNSVAQRYAINFRGSVHDRAIAIRDVTLVGADDELKTALATIARLAADYDKSAAPLDKMMAEPGAGAEQRQILAGIKQTEARTLPIIEKVIALRQGGQLDEAKALMLKEARPAFVEWLTRINQFIDAQEKLNQDESARARQAASGFQTLSLIMCGAALAIGALVATVVSGAILRALGGEPGDASAIARSIAAGDLGVAIAIRPGDHSSVLCAMRDMRDSLVQIVADIRASTGTIATASREIASGNQDLSSRTEQQAGSLQETASSMGQLTSTVKQNADNARQANALAVSASDVALKGGAVVAQVVRTMDSISASSNKIVDIISVIDGIAFQTNILALNAAVEAARAGEQGRGFAVVATEVRNLAQRSAAAAREIKTLIGDSVEQVGAGGKLVADAGHTMEEIVTSVRRVTDIMAEIMAATVEQGAGIEQVNHAIGQMDAVTQQNAALVEEAAAAAESMQDQAASLEQVVSVFSLGNAAPVQRLTMATPLAVKPAAKKIVAPAPARRLTPVRSTAKAAPRLSSAKPSPAQDEWEEF